MGISHEYRSGRRARHGSVNWKLRLLGAFIAILLVSYAITAILEHGAAGADATPEVNAGGIAENILAPLPMQGEAASGADSTDSTVQDSAGAVTLESFGPARQSDGAAAVKGALICGYTGVGPDAIVNRSAVKSSTRGEEIALDVLAAAQPKKLYILLGTNTLTTLGTADRFLAYYGQMLDTLRETLGSDCVIYVQSIPPVRPSAAAEKPGLASDVLRGVNEQLAQLADSKGCVYLDLWETLADGEGNLKEMLAAPDGIHFSAGNGYGAWVTYLRNHAKYSASNSWTMGSVYSTQ